MVRALLTTLIAKYGECHVAVNGKEALDAVQSAFNENQPYDLICLDIMMLVMDGQETLLELRKMEEDMYISPSHITKVIMVTAVDDSKNMMKSLSRRTV